MIYYMEKFDINEGNNQIKSHLILLMNQLNQKFRMVKTCFICQEMGRDKYSWFKS